MNVDFTDIESIPRYEGYESLSVHFTGGLRAFSLSADTWSVSPVLRNGVPCIAGRITGNQMRHLMKALGQEPVILEHRSSTDGAEFSTFRSVRPATRNPQVSVADLWTNMSGNIKRRRAKEFFKQNPEATSNDIDRFFDSASLSEKLVSHVSGSLRSLDICLGAISSFYHDQLIGAMRSGKKPTDRFSTILDLSLTANVHSFFLHLGAAFGYLGALIANRCGFSSRTDDLARLIGELRSDQMPTDSMLDLFLSKGLVVPVAGSKKHKLGGWLASTLKIRNDFVHKRPYGSVQCERSGQIGIFEGDQSFWKYRRSILVDSIEQDALTLISKIYHKCTDLFEEMNAVSGYDASIPILSDKDILDFKLHSRKPPGD
jgi:hypothetical protein